MLHKTHKTRFPNLDASSSLEAWREAKKVADPETTFDKNRQDMYDAFGCHGEPIADAIFEGFMSMLEHVREELEPLALEKISRAFDSIGDNMTHVREELDSRLDLYVREANQRAFQEALDSLPSGSDLYAADHGVDLNTTLEGAFEAGVYAAASSAEALEYDDGSSHSLDDL
jgi:hypothetical protein